MLCRTADRGSCSKTFKQSILDKCIERNDEWAGQVRVHVEGAISDQVIFTLLMVATLLIAWPNS